MARPGPSGARETRRANRATITSPVLFTNNYPMVEARAGWRLGHYPAHHLYGTAVLEQHGLTVLDMSRDEVGALGRLNHLTRGQLGDLAQQWRVVRHRRDAAAVVAGEPDSLRSLLLLKSAGLRLPPVVAVVHEAPTNALVRRALRGADRLVAISARVAAELLADGADPARVTTLPWGPDLRFPGYGLAVTDEFVLSTGKTRRDTPTLLAALRGTDIPAVVYVGAGAAADAAASLPNVRAVAPVAPRPPGSPLTYGHVLDDLRRAAVVAIPLLRARRPIGLTEVDDALALGKPIVITETDYVDCDVEAVGCGIRVGLGDVDGWRRALTSLMADADMRREMGERGRRWAEERFNAELFGAGILALVAELSAAA